MRLNLGCGRKKRFGWVNVDCDSVCEPDIMWDLEDTPWPWESESVDRVSMIHVMEHLGETSRQFLKIIQELYRVCRPGALIEIAVPHPRNNAFIGDPTHVRPINDLMLMLFSKKHCLNTKTVSGLAFKLDVDFEIVESEAILSPGWKMRSENLSASEMQFASEHYFNVIDEIKITWRRV